ncbi:MAG TPA: ABC transporter ATP-binding protein [Candidatus Dormibacteraeota bacterium]|nr:ABC transporter ATP-binding protein [Candidatus Dormibacteraeota bacterium]
MSQPAVEVKKLAKMYQISHQTAEYETFRDAMVNFAKKPLRALAGKTAEKEKFWALNGLSFEVQPGEVVGIIGRNGSGKSTLLKILSKIVDPTSGQAVMRGKVASLLEVGTGFHPELTGRENIYFNGSILGMSRKEINNKFHEIVAFSEIEQFLDTPVKFYSSGMYVRLAFAVAAHLEPDILIVDEVLAVGDAEFQKKCLGKMKDVSSKGRTVLFVSHNMETVRQLCSRVILLEKGRIKSEGNPTQVSNEYIGYQQHAKAAYKFKVDKHKDAQFSEIKLLGSTGKQTSTVKAGETWSVAMDYAVNQPLKDALLIVEVQSNEYETIYCTTDSDHSSKIIPKTVGRYHVEIKFDRFHLNPGNYNLRISLQSPGRAMHHEVNDLILTVEPDTEDIRGTYFGGQYYGYISDKVEWSITKEK